MECFEPIIVDIIQRILLLVRIFFSVFIIKLFSIVKIISNYFEVRLVANQVSKHFSWLISVVFRWKHFELFLRHRNLRSRVTFFLVSFSRLFLFIFHLFPYVHLFRHFLFFLHFLLLDLFCLLRLRIIWLYRFRI